MSARAAGREEEPAGGSFADGSWEATEDAPRTVTSPESMPPERTAEAALRPRRLEEFVGQQVVRDQLSLVLDAAAARGRAPEHMLADGLVEYWGQPLAIVVAETRDAALAGAAAVDARTTSSGWKLT